jgi:outer membrane protein insertion porin family
VRGTGRGILAGVVGLLVFTGLAAGAAGLAHAQERPPVVVKDLGIEGHRRVHEAVILGRVKTRPGDVFDPTQLSEDLRAIFALGFFDDVQMRVEDFEGGLRVTFVVEERPFVRDVSFTGNQRLAAATLHEKIDLRLGSVYNPVEVQRTRERLREAYEEEGYFEARIGSEIETFPDGDVRVVFAIEEGRRMTIDRIVFEGNQTVRDRDLKGVLVTRERHYWVLRGVVQRQQLEADIDRILELYNDRGHVQARVESHEVTVDRDRARVTVTFRIVEGPRFHVGAVAVQGVTVLPESEVRRQIPLKPGDVFSRSKVRQGIRSITDLYSTIGRAAVEVQPRTEPAAAPERLDLVFEIVEGPEVYVERIDITGNTRSEDRVLRREIPIAEGDLFTIQKLARARQRLVNLGYFERVDITTQPGSDQTRVIVTVDVTERPTGLFSIGGGFSSVDSFVGTLDLSQRNFLGRGWELSLRLRLGARTQQGVVSFTEPWLFDRPLAAGFDVFNVRRQFDEFDYDSLGGGLRLSHPFAEFARWHLGYRLTRDEISALVPTATAALLAEEGSRLTSRVSGALSYDSRDNIMAPTAGSSAVLNADFAGAGGDTRYVKTLGSVTHFRPIWFGHIISGRAEAGYGMGWGGEEVPLFERFYLGGPASIRGVKFRQISPVDAQGIRIGGTSMLLGNVEYIVPLPLNFRVAGFFDIGNVYGFGRRFDPTDTREAAGVGIRWLSPFGPIRVDYGFNLDRRAGEDAATLHFSAGSPF